MCVCVCVCVWGVFKKGSRYVRAGLLAGGGEGGGKRVRVISHNVLVYVDVVEVTESAVWIAFIVGLTVTPATVTGLLASSCSFHCVFILCWNKVLFKPTVTIISLNPPSSIPGFTRPLVSVTDRLPFPAHSPPPPPPPYNGLSPLPPSTERERERERERES